MIINSKYLPKTATKPHRAKAWVCDEAGTVSATVVWDSTRMKGRGMSQYVCAHFRAVEALCKKRGYQGVVAYDQDLGRVGLTWMFVGTGNLETIGNNSKMTRDAVVQTLNEGRRNDDHLSNRAG